VKDRNVDLNIIFEQVFRITRLSEYEGTVLAQDKIQHWIFVEEENRVKDGVKIRVRYYGNVKELNRIRAEYNREFLFSQAMPLSVP
jgi:hypothetical protein